MYSQNDLVSRVSQVEQAEFFKKTYLHVAGAILAFVMVETFLINFVPENLILAMLGGQYVWLFILGLFWLGTNFSNNLAIQPSRDKQYLGLSLSVILHAIIFLPVILIATKYTNENIIMQATIITLFMFSGLTAVALFSNKDFSFLRSIVTIGSFIALGTIVAGALFKFNLGLWFSLGMIILGSASILYKTQEIRDQYTTNHYVGASQQLFASIMFLFWYVLRILMSKRD